MKSIKIAFVVLLSSIFVSGYAQDKRQKSPFDIGVHLGLDLGAAVPWPISRLSDGSYKFSAVPKISPAIGASLSYNITDNFTLSVESTYKTVGIDASTWVKNQRFTIDYDPVTYQYFTGTADAYMSFSMLEVPLFVKYNFNDNKNTVMIGGYYSWIIKGRFETIAKKGTLTEEPLDDDYNLTPGEIVYEPVSMLLDDYLGHWDSGWMIGYERRVFNEVYFGARFMMGLHDIFKTKCLEYEMWHMRGCFSVAWRPFA